MNKEDLLIIRQVIEVCDRLTDEEIEMAQECIDKQIPEKPVCCGVNPDLTHQYQCPVCGRLWWEKNFIGAFCDSCGQAVDLEVQ